MALITRNLEKSQTISAPERRNDNRSATNRVHSPLSQPGVDVERVSAESSAARRAQWLAELSEALEQAHNLMWKLGIGDGGGPAAMELYLRIEAARLEVQAFRLGQRYEKAQEIHPERTDPWPWQRSGTDDC